MIALPPSFSGRVHTRTTAPFVGVAVKAVGATGTPAGTTEPARLDAPTVTAFNALTRKLYEVPFVKPVAVYVVAVDALSETMVVHVAPEFTERSMRYPTMAEPPLVVGAVHDNDAVVLPGETISAIGADGAPAGTVALLDVVAPVPAWFTAAMRYMYDVPFVSPVTVKRVRPELVLADTVDQVAPASSDCSMTYPVMDAPFEAPATQVSNT